MSSFDILLRDTGKYYNSLKTWRDWVSLNVILFVEWAVTWPQLYLGYICFPKYLIWLHRCYQTEMGKKMPPSILSPGTWRCGCLSVWLLRGSGRSQIEPLLFYTKAGCLGRPPHCPLVSTCLRSLGCVEKEHVLGKKRLRRMTLGKDTQQRGRKGKFGHLSFRTHTQQ